MVNTKSKSKNNSKKSKSYSKKSKTYSKKSKMSKRTKSRIMRGGDDGRTAFSGSYFGNGTRGYHPEGSSKLSTGNQLSVSRGKIWENGKYTGPNVFPTMGGGDCGCKRKPKNKQHKRKTAKKQSGGFWAELLG